MDVVKDANGKPMTPGSLYTYTENEKCFWQVYTIVNSKDDAHNGMKARIYYVPTDCLRFKRLDPNTKSVLFDVDERRHPDYGCIKTCSFRMEDVARYVIPVHCSFIRNPGRILHASTDHLTVGSQITVNPDYKRICLLHSTAVAATRYLLDDTYEIYVTESNKDHFSIKFRKKSAQAKEIHIRDIFTMNAHLFVTQKNGDIELQIARIRQQYETELQTIQSKSSEAVDKIQKQMAQDCKSALRNMQERVMSIANNELQAKQLEVDELKKQLAKAEQDRQRSNDRNGQSSNGGSGDSDQAWSAVVALAKSSDESSNVELAQSSEQSSNGGSNRSAAQPATRDGRRDGESSINLWIRNKKNGIKITPSFWYSYDTKRHLIDLKRDYCQKNGLEQNKMRFLFNESVVYDTQTPDDLKMKNGDIIDAMTCEEYSESNEFGEELKLLKEPYGSRGRDVQLATASNGGSQKRERNNDNLSGTSHQKQVKREEREN